MPSMDLKTFVKCFRKVYEDMPKEPEVKNLKDVKKNNGMPPTMIGGLPQRAQTISLDSLD